MTIPVEPTVLAAMPLFKGLAPSELSRITQALHRRNAPAGVGLFSVDQPGEVVYIIQSGTVKVHVEQGDGDDVTLAILGPGQTVGEMAAADSLTRSATVVTLEPSVLLWTNRVTFQHWLRTYPQIALNLVRILSRRLRVANAHIQSLASLDVYGRVARQLLVLCEEYGVPDSQGGARIPLRLTQTDLAELVGASRVRINQVIGDYKELGYIAVSREHYVTVRDRAALAARCE
ncbi:MAG: Crp/Fnr family transcriptional regulator [Chloroflexia bacterium]